MAAIPRLQTIVNSTASARTSETSRNNRLHYTTTNIVPINKMRIALCARAAAGQKRGRRFWSVSTLNWQPGNLLGLRSVVAGLNSAFCMAPAVHALPGHAPLDESHLRTAINIQIRLDLE